MTTTEPQTPVQRHDEPHRFDNKGDGYCRIHGCWEPIDAPIHLQSTEHAVERVREWARTNPAQVDTGDASGVRTSHRTEAAPAQPTPEIHVSNDVDVIVSGSLLVIRKANFQQEAMVAVLKHEHAESIIRALEVAHGLASRCTPEDAPQRFPDFDSLLEVVGEIGEELDAEGLNLEVADRIYERGRQDGLKAAAPEDEVEKALAELREVFPGERHFISIGIDAVDRPAPYEAVRSARIQVSTPKRDALDEGGFFSGATLADCMAAVRAWKENQTTL